MVTGREGKERFPIQRLVQKLTEAFRRRALQASPGAE